MVRCLLASAIALLTFGIGGAAADQVSPNTIGLQTNDVRVAEDGSSVQTTHAEIHADNDAGAMRLGQVQLAYNSSNQDVKIDEAYTLKADGTKIPVDMSAVFVRMPGDNGLNVPVSDQRLKVIVFPQLVAGDTAVYTATYTNGVAVFPHIFMFAEAFNPAVPIKEERVSITAPKDMGLRTETHDVAFAQETSGDDVVYRWRYSASKSNPTKLAAVSPLDQLPRFFVSNFKDYNDLGRAYGAIMSAKLQVTPKVAALADKLTAGESNPSEQARKIYEWVNTNVRYIAIELGRGTMVPHDVDAILTYGYGDCKDHDLVLRALLKAKGIASEDVLLNSSNAYTLTQVPTFIQIDHVITYVPALKLYLDSSAFGTPFGVLPYTEYGKPAIHVSGESATLGVMPVLPPGPASESTTSRMRLSAAGVLTGEVASTATGPSQIKLRVVGLALQAVNADALAAQQLTARGYAGGSGTIKADPPLVRGPSYTINGQFTIPGWSEWLTGRKFSFMPVGLRVLAVAGDGPVGTFAALKAGDFSPVPCFSMLQTEDDSLEIPASARFLAVPADTQLRTQNIQFTAHWTLSGNTLSVHREFRSMIDQPLCTAAMRRQMAPALVQIVASYLAPVRIAPATAPMVSENDTAPLDSGGVGASARGGVVAMASLGDEDRALRPIGPIVASAREDGEERYYYLVDPAQVLDDFDSAPPNSEPYDDSESGPEPY